VTLIVVVWAMLADWAVTMIEAVPRFARILLPYPPPLQPPIASTSTTIASDAAAARIEVRLLFCNFPPHSIARLNKLRAKKKSHTPSSSGVKTRNAKR
jgi:hypothetical protein